MPGKPSHPPKPVSETWRPELVRLPALTSARRAFRSFVRAVLKAVAWICLKIDSEGLENIPQNGPLLIVINHLGHADTPTVMSSLPFMPDALGGIELYDVPILGRLADWYGIIWLHRGRADTRALRAALDGLAQGRILVIAPEGRYSLTGALEEGTTGAAFLAMKSGAPILPIALVGTENPRVFGFLKRFKRAPVQLRVGKLFKLENQESARHEALNQGTEQIMKALANLLPERYRGEYS